MSPDVMQDRPEFGLPLSEALASTEGTSTTQTISVKCRQSTRVVIIYIGCV